MPNKYKKYKKLQVDKQDNYFKPLEVKIKYPASEDSVNKALSVLKRIIKNSNLFKDLQEKRYFTKNSDKKRRKRQLAILRNKYNQV